jgi:lipoteichoic acid synthase
MREVLIVPLAYAAALALFVIKTLTVTRILGYEISLSTVVNTTAAAALLTSWCILFGKRAAVTLLCIAVGLLSFILWGDALYHQYYNRILLYAMHDHVRELFEVSDSAMDLLPVWHLLIYADIVVIAVLGARLLRRDHFRRFGLAWRAAVLAVILAAAGLTLHGQYRWFVKPPGENEIRFEPEQVTRVGVYAYHLFDIIRYRTQGAAVPVPPGLVERVKVFTKKQHADFSAMRDEGWGSAAGSNVIVVLLESAQSFLVDYKVDGQEVTPTLNRLAHEGIFFSNAYTQIGPGCTSDAELLTQFSLFPLAEELVFSSYGAMPLSGLSDILASKGYHGYVFHGNEASFWDRDRFYARHGIEKFYDESDFIADEKIALGLSDASFFRQLSGIFATKLARPFYGLIITLSTHHPFVLPARDITLKVPAGFSKPKFAHYLEAMNYMDRSLGTFIDALDKGGLLENSVVVLFGDHMAVHGYYGKDLCALLKRPPNPIEHFKVPIIIRPPGKNLPGLRGKVVSLPAGEVDMAPTLLYLLGLEPKGAFFGKNLLMAKKNTVVLSRLFLPEGSFVSDRHIFLNGYSRNRRCFDAASLAAVPVSDCSGELQHVASMLMLSDTVIKGGVRY